MRPRILIPRIVVLGAAIAIVTLSRPSKPASAGLVAERVKVQVTIDSLVGETFSPPPSTTPNLDPESAWAAYAKLNGSTVESIPNDMTVQLGLLTLPVGPVGPNNSYVYTAKDQLAYGYSRPSCPVSLLGPAPSDSPCVEWLFLDANTGQQIDETWQR
jgi:hypothetical protein